MSFNVLPFGSTRVTAGQPETAVEPDPTCSDFADVVDIATRREPHTDASEIPDEVWAEIEAGSRLSSELRSQNREVRFETDPVSGRVVASLCDLDGGVVRVLPLREALGPGDHGPAGPSAA